MYGGGGGGARQTSHVLQLYKNGGDCGCKVDFVATKPPPVFAKAAKAKLSLQSAWLQSSANLCFAAAVLTLQWRIFCLSVFLCRTLRIGTATATVKRGVVKLLLPETLTLPTG